MAQWGASLHRERHVKVHWAWDDMCEFLQRTRVSSRSHLREDKEREREREPKHQAAFALTKDHRAHTHTHTTLMVLGHV
eukprot:191972-Amphidinium_carterae.1